jgi:hypothetical protein
MCTRSIFLIHCGYKTIYGVLPAEQSNGFFLTTERLILEDLTCDWAMAHQPEHIPKGFVKQQPVY